MSDSGNPRPAAEDPWVDVDGVSAEARTVSLAQQLIHVKLQQHTTHARITELDDLVRADPNLGDALSLVAALKVQLVNVGKELELLVSLAETL